MQVSRIDGKNGRVFPLAVSVERAIAAKPMGRSDGLGNIFLYGLIGWGLLLQQVWLLWAFSQTLEYLAQAKQILT